MIPSILARQLEEGLNDYIETTFPMTNEGFKGTIEQMLLTKGTVFHEPYASVKMPFRTTAEKFDGFEALHPSFNPYLHQNKSWTRLVGSEIKSTLVATGTGSGKTECFLYPILDYCYRHRDEKGIKALIIYPMNALASDQAKRIAEEIFKLSELKGKVTVGMYVGGLTDKPSLAMGEHGVITDHETMLTNPPDILMTNYKMLDYLLVRPKDAKLWADNAPETLKFIAVDELHTFDGAQGTDLACLLRRLKTRLQTPEGHICCVGTSATMGSGEGDKKALLDYAKDIFGEIFDSDSVITEDRLVPEEMFVEEATDFKTPVEKDLEELRQSFREDDDKKFLARAVAAWIDGTFTYDDIFSDETRIALGQRLLHHNFTRALLNLTRGGFAQNSKALESLKDQFPSFAELSDASFALDCLYALISHARGGVPGKTRPFLTVQLQLWMRELTRVVATVSKGDIKYALAGDLNNDQIKHYLPVINCRDCGMTGWVTTLNEKHNAAITDYRAFYNKFFDGDKEVIFFYPHNGNSVPNGFSRAYICPSCMHVKFADSPTTNDVCPECGQPGVPVIFRTKGLETHTYGENKHFVCPHCHSKNGAAIVGLRSATAISAEISQLFASKFNDDKKTLAFSDNVQDAAQRAGFFSSRTWRFVLREAIQRYVNDGGEGQTLNEFEDGFISYWKANMSIEEFVSNFIPHNLTWMKAFDTMKEKGKFPVKEGTSLLTNIEKRLRYEISLEYGLTSHVGRTLLKSGCSGLTYDETAIPSIAFEVREKSVNELGFAPSIPLDAYEKAVVEVIEIMRSKGAFNEKVYEDYKYFESGGKTYNIINPRTLSWMPKNSASRNAPSFPYIKTGSFNFPKDSQFISVMEGSIYTSKIGLCLDPLGTIVAGQAYSHVLKYILLELAKSGLVVEEKFPAFVVYALNKDAMRVTKELTMHSCDRCGQKRFIPANLAAFGDGMGCPMPKCPGLLHPISSEPDYYNRLYNNSDIVRVYAREHTGLLERDDREALEASFKAKKGERKPWDTNILSCTPTLEMGIDIGDLSTVFLCSMPPAQAQYLQRVGRAGRSDGNALVVAVANSRPHDLYFYAEPSEMIEGSVQPPRVFLNASAVLERQLIAYCMDAWVKSGIAETAIPKALGGVLAHLGTADPSNFPYNFLAYTQSHLSDLLSGFLSMFPELNDVSKSELKAFAMGGSLAKDNLSTRSLNAFLAMNKQKKSINENIRKINDLIAELEKKPKDSSYDEEKEELELEKKALSRLLFQINEKDVFNFLSDEGLLPNYAFPEAGVVLKAILRRRAEGTPAAERESGEAKPKRIPSVIFEYNRSASSAISELAPMNTFYASGHKLEVDQVDIPSAEIGKWRLCPDCSHAEPLDEVGHTKDAYCPCCGSTGWSDEGQVRDMMKAKMVYSTGYFDETLIDDSSENRSNRFYNKQTLIDVDEEADIEKAYRMDNADFPFGFEFVRKAVIREINFGEAGDEGEQVSVDGDDSKKRGFRICRYCGKVDRKDKKFAHAKYCKTVKQPELAKDAFIDCLFLYRDLQTEALRILLPATTLDPSGVKIESFEAAFMLGLKQYFGNVDNLRLTVGEVPVPDSTYRKQYLVLYDSVPGGTGYLKQLLANKNSMIEILEKALAVMKSCSCNDDPQKDGCYHCLYAYRQSQSMGSISRDAAVRMFEQILSGRDNIEEIKGISSIPVDPIFDSELEAKFVAALQTLGNASRPISLKKEFVRNTNGYLLTIGDCRWEIEPQHNLGLSDGVAVPCKPDFVFWPIKGSKQKPICVFADGFKYHKHITDEDTVKREAIRRSGKFRVWTFSYNDVDSAFKAHANYFTSLFDIHLMDSPQMYAHGSVSKVDVAKKSALDIFAEYLSDPEAEASFYLRARNLSVCVLNMKSYKDAAVYQALLGEVKQFYDGLLITRTFTAGQNIFGKINLDPAHRCSVYADNTIADIFKDGPSNVLAYLDDTASLDKEYEKDWNGFWLFANVMQFLGDHFVMVTRKGIGSSYYSKLAPWESMSEEESAEPSDETDPWETVKEALFDEDSIQFAERCVAQKIKAPDIVGFELEDGGVVIAEAEMVWSDKKIALLLDYQMEDNKAPLEERGYRVIDAVHGVELLSTEEHQ